MILSAKTNRRWNADPFVVRISTDPSRPTPLRRNEALLLQLDGQSNVSGFRAYFGSATSSPESVFSADAPVVQLPESLSYVRDRDIVAVRPSTGDLRV